MMLRNSLNNSRITIYRTMSTISQYLRYSEYGEPNKVVGKFEERIPDPTGTQLLAKILVSPINPADINTIQGMCLCGFVCMHL